MYGVRDLHLPHHRKQSWQWVLIRWFNNRRALLLWYRRYLVKRGTTKCTKESNGPPCTGWDIKSEIKNEAKFNNLIGLVLHPIPGNLQVWKCRVILNESLQCLVQVCGGDGTCFLEGCLALHLVHDSGMNSQLSIHPYLWKVNWSCAILWCMLNLSMPQMVGHAKFVVGLLVVPKQNDLVHGWGIDFKIGYCAQVPTYYNPPRSPNS